MFDYFEWFPIVLLAVFVFVPVGVVVSMHRSPEARASRLGRADFHAGIDQSDDFVSYECGVAYRRGRALAERDLRDIEEYRLQLQDMDRLKGRRR